ncbi:BTB/POZ domain-containing protein 2 [Ooceraea biroi]|uniref:BTB/POZ domain-containing protein 2 n=1 Tax=Ooceraea biroi TaxID=2015173 RepID=UPI000F08EA26|nr:BTB/POZ domain-containing protein 2 [Ooceraea biroi]
MTSPCFDWQTSKEKFTERGQYLFETGLWSDCEFIVGQEPEQQIFKGHKLFLVMSSPIFETMVGSMTEKNDPILIKDVQPKAFKVLLEYIYTEKAELTSFELVCELYYCANRYMLPALVKKCTEYLCSNLSPKGACRAYELAKLFEKYELMKKCLDIICTRTAEVLNESSWENIELATLLTVLDQENLKISSEIELFTAVEKWAKSECCRKCLDPANREDLRFVIGDAFSKLRFLSLTPQEFATGPALSPMFSQDEAFSILLNICTDDKTIVPVPEGFCTISNSRANTIRIKFSPPSFQQHVSY